jgi:hypothetical protein
MRLSALLTIDVVVEATHVCNLLKQQFCDDVKTEKTDQPNPHKPFYTSTMRFSKELDGFVTNNALEIAKKYLSTLPPPPLQPKTHDSHGLQPLPRVPLPQVPLPEKEKEKENIPDTKSHKAAQKREREEEETTCVNASKRVKVTAETPSSLIAP